MSEPASEPTVPPAAAAAASAAAGGAVPAEQQALHEALAQLLGPVARLAVERGLPFAAAQELLKLAFVSAAAAAHPHLAAHRKVSRIATTTGINRREVTRLVADLGGPARSAGPARESESEGAWAPGREAPRAGARPLGRSAAAEICAHWRIHAPWRADDGTPRALPRTGPAPSFEALAAEITRDVHPRSLLEELCRLGLAQHDLASDTVALVGEGSVPRGNRARMLGVLAANVGAHLRAAVENVLAAETPPHLEQALFAEGLSEASLQALRPLLRDQWARLRQALVPALEERVALDAATGGPRVQLRLGLYAHADLGQLAAGTEGTAGAPQPAQREGAAGSKARTARSNTGPAGPTSAAGSPAPRPRRIVRPAPAPPPRPKRS